MAETVVVVLVLFLCLPARWSVFLKMRRLAVGVNDLSRSAHSCYCFGCVCHVRFSGRDYQAVLWHGCCAKLWLLGLVATGVTLIGYVVVVLRQDLGSLVLEFGPDKNLNDLSVPWVVRSCCSDS